MQTQLQGPYIPDPSLETETLLRGLTLISGKEIVQASPRQHPRPNSEVQIQDSEPYTLVTEI